MNIQIFSALRRINRHIKKQKKEWAGEIMSPVRRIEFVAQPKERVCAMTFDDGPTAAPCIPSKDSGKGLTAHLLDVLNQYHAKATFDVVGSTAENYPDTKGALHNHFVFGTKYDHYPAYGRDDEAGVAACPDLLRRMVAEGHEIANHGYQHRIFGPEYFVYRKRVFQRNLEEVLADLKRLHDFVKTSAGYEITLSRPPHYIDRIGRFGRATAYTAYAQMGYHYMAANLDGGGWYPTTGDYTADVQSMLTPLDKMLRDDPDSLSGSVIFQKDGYNMSMQSPVADALGKQLDLLSAYGYRVVGVGELMKLSPFEDVTHMDEAFESVRKLDSAGYVIGFRNNCFKPDVLITLEQLDAMMTKRHEYKARRCKSRAAMRPDEIRRVIAERFGDCLPLKGNSRREAALVLCESIQCFSTSTA